jgi:hypothetical protein
MKKVILVAAMAAVVVIAGITGASSAAHAAVFFTPAGTAMMSSFVPLISGFFHHLFRFLSYMRIQSL